MSEKSIEAALRIIEGSGPPGFYIAAALVGLALVVIVIANFAGLYDDRRSASTKTDFLDRVVKQYAEVSKSEAELRRETSRRERENDALLDRQRELLTSLELLRSQLGRAITLMRAVSEGRLQPAELDAHLKDLAP